MAQTLKKRLVEIDLLRSIAILGMVVYHAAFDLEYFYDWNIPLYQDWWLLLARSTASLFVVLVGVSFMISSQHRSTEEIWKKSFRRAGIILANAALISIVTYIVNPHTYIRFGILHMIGVSALLLPIFRNFKQWNLCIGMIVILVGMMLRETILDTSLLLPLGITPSGFATLDYFPLLPWFGVILVGMAAGTIFYDSMEYASVETQRCCVSANTWQILAMPGRHSLLIYMLHQPILMTVLWLIL